MVGRTGGFRLIDAHEAAATLQAGASIVPVNENGKLVIRVDVLYRNLEDFGALTGQVLDDQSQPLAGVRVGLAASTPTRVSNDLRHQSTTNAQGRYRLRDIPRPSL